MSGPSLQGIPSWKAGRQRKLSRSPLVSRLLSGSCSFHTCFLQRIDLVFSIVRYFQRLFPLSLELSLVAAAQKAGFSSCLAREEKMFLTIFVPGLQIHSFQQYHDVQRHQWLFAVLTV